MKKLKDNYPFLIIAIYILAVIIFYGLMGTSGIVINGPGLLNTFIPEYKLLKDAGAFFNNKNNIQIFYSVTRNYLPSGVSFISFIFMLFPVYAAYVILIISKTLIAVSGVYFLSKEYLHDISIGQKNIILIFGLAFGCMPLSPQIGIAIASLPWLIFFIRNFNRKADIRTVLFLIIYPLFSELYNVSPVILLCLLIATVIFSIIRRKFQYKYLIVFFLLVIGFAASQYNYFYELFFDDAYLIGGISNITGVSFSHAISQMLSNLAINDYTNDGVVYLSVILFAVIYYCLIRMINYNLCKDSGLNGDIEAEKQYKKGNGKMINILITVVMIIAFALSLVTDYRYNDLLQTMLKTGPTYEEYYSSELMDHIKNDIDYKEQWSATIGFDPALLEYNGINSIDGSITMDAFYPEYCNSYIPEILGGYSEQTGFTKDFDIDAFKEFGGYYIFSEAEIPDAAGNGLELVNKYSGYGSSYDIYLYQVISRYPEKEHSDIPMEDRLSIDYDLSEYDDIYEAVEILIDEANAYKDSHSDSNLSDDEIVSALGKEEEMKNNLKESLDYIDDLTTQHTLASYQYYQDVLNEDTENAVNEIYEDLLELYDRNSQLFRDVCTSPYVYTFSSEYGAAYASEYAEYENMTDEEKERELKLESLSHEYEQDSMDDYYFNYQGQEWSFDKFEEEYGKLEAGEDSQLNNDNLYPIYYGLYKEKSKVVGEIYLEIIQLEDEIAKEEGYDNYADYAYECVYSRDYTVDDVMEMCREVRNGGLQYVIGVEYMLEDEADLDPGYITEDDTETFEMLLPYINDIDSELGTSMEHLLDCHLYDLKYNENKPDTGFTSGLPKYGDAYIFDSPYQLSSDLFTYVHEFGHYNNVYYNNENSIEEVDNIDVREIHSQGLEMLMASKYRAIYGDELGNYLEMSDVSQMVENIMEACMISEFEIYAYKHPDSSIEELGEYYYELMLDYGYDYYDVDDGQLYTWCDIPHIFESPLYYISYATSAVAALDIYNLSKEDYDLGVEKYMEISAMPSTMQYVNATKTAGLQVPFYKGSTKEILKKAYLALAELK